ncbi:hypothetical protein ACFV5N_11730, partial [Streptomyces sp. NPDC059853]|uniref:hypothetical protein n=1 Tax=Streptomyces sp. NPDC059853 TaxID=3346973 RepID=UPI0036568A93
MIRIITAARLQELRDAEAAGEADAAEAARWQAMYEEERERTAAARVSCAAAEAEEEKWHSRTTQL